ncbi:efflux RND transporter periplasmic adaptor subunit [Salegentibacter sp. JZCK2]|uniref:efflux RND transporter periplasmic adaptor subunit n=1 Tax=Salegentibacter tibetensis TaxID=2873600 RepID=UPI001CCEC026|nr:efflux RND transporter periplasmic adaptor subunit [Salegentibacter tibetensis]MBZ9728167.1 efflux RND transporter periplasmic adaptor subunit [Salegentibacter tibetensis]
MKKLAVLLSIPLLLLSCGNNEEGKSIDEIIENEDLTEIRAKKAELSKEQSDLTQKLDKLDQAIDRLDKTRRLDLVVTQKISDTLFKHYAEVQGDVATDENIVIYSEFSGILQDLRVQEGQEVNKGQVLAKIDDGGLASELAQLETQATLAKTTFERQERLWEQNIGSEMQYLEAKANFESVQNSVKRLQAQLDKTIVRAPFSGIVDEVLTEQGEVVSPGQSQLFRLVSLKNMYVEAAVPENYLNTVRKGTEVIVEISSLDREFEGEIRRVGNTINPNNRSFIIQVAVPNENGMIKPNQIATIRLNDYTAENAIIIPENALLKNSQGESVVFILQEKEGEENIGTAKRQIVETGYNYNNLIEITKGLESGETLIVEGAKNLRDGQEVKIRN